MTNAGQIVAAFRDIAATKSLSQDEVYDLIKDGIVAGLIKIYGPNVEAEIDIDEGSGDIEIIVPIETGGGKKNNDSEKNKSMA